MKNWKNRKTPWKRNGNHVVWLEPKRKNFRIGESIEIKAMWGSMRNPDPGEPEKWHAYILDGESQLELPIRAEMRGYVDGSPCHILSFKPKREGTYTVVLENKIGILNELENGDWVYGPRKHHENVKESNYFYQSAKTRVQVEAAQKETPSAGNELEILPTEPLPTDGTVELSLLYRGTPLAGAEIRATYSNYPYSEDDPPGFYPYTSTTDSEGKAKFEVKERGNWLFVADHEVEKGVKGEYDGKRITASLSLPGFCREE